mgnify:CR=1 FL=1
MKEKKQSKQSFLNLALIIFIICLPYVVYLEVKLIDPSIVEPIENKMSIIYNIGMIGVLLGVIIFLIDLSFPKLIKLLKRIDFLYYVKNALILMALLIVITLATIFFENIVQIILGLGFFFLLCHCLVSIYIKMLDWNNEPS